jgi:HK97 family phage portal protein
VSAYETPSGLLVNDRRALQRVYDRDDLPNPNPPIGSVGPQSPAGEVMGFTPPYGAATAPLVPPGAQAWAGWPNGWTVPWSSMQGGLAMLGGLISIIWLCIDMNTSILATMPPYVARDDEILDTPPSWLVNPQPEVYTGWGEFLRQLFASWWLGEAFVWATSRYADGWPRTFVVLNPNWVSVELDGGERRFRLGGQDITADVLHLRYASWPGEAHGYGPLSAAYGPMTTAQAVEQYVASMAARGGVPWAVLQHPQTLTAKQTDELRARYVQARYEARTRGEDAAPLILSGGLTLQPLQISVKDLALIDLMRLSEQRLALMFSVPPSLVGLPSGEDSLTYNNAEEFRLQHWQAFLRPKAQLVMEALSNWLLPRGTVVELDRDEYVRPPLLERAQTYEIMIRSGVMSEAEARKRERLAGPPPTRPDPVATPMIANASDQGGGNG